MNNAASASALAWREYNAIDCPCMCRNCGPADSPSTRSRSSFGRMSVAEITSASVATAKNVKMTLCTARGSINRSPPTARSETAANRSWARSNRANINGAATRAVARSSLNSAMTNRASAMSPPSHNAHARTPTSRSK